MKTNAILSLCGVLALFAATLFNLSPVQAGRSKREYSESVAKSVRSYLDVDDWNYSFDSSCGIFYFTVRGFDSTFSKLDYRIIVGKEHYVIKACFPLNANCDDEKKIGEVAELICRMNYGLKNGGFDLDYSDGEISYRIFVDCDQLPLSNDRVEESILLSSCMFEKYGNAILSVLSGDALPEDAVAEAEDE